MAKCPHCEAEAENYGDLRHRNACPRQTDHERIKELEEALTLARYEINRVLDHPIGRRRP